MNPLCHVYNLYPGLYVRLIDWNYQGQGNRRNKKGDIMQNFIIRGKAKNVFQTIKLMAEAEKKIKEQQKKAKTN
jgi:hypothetical protein